MSSQVLTKQFVRPEQLTRRAVAKQRWPLFGVKAHSRSLGFLRISCQSLVASVNFMRLSLKKAAYVAVDESSVVGNPEFARDDKVRVCASMQCCC